MFLEEIFDKNVFFIKHLLGIQIYLRVIFHSKPKNSRNHNTFTAIFLLYFIENKYNA